MRSLLKDLLLYMMALARFKTGFITISLLVMALLWVPIADAAPGKSDLNHDGVVDYDDLVIFSSKYLGQNVDTVDWCAFYEATSREDKLYGRKPDFFVKHFSKLLSFINNKFNCDLSDLNKDGMIDSDDLFIFSSRYLELSHETVDWCAFYAATIREERFNDKFTLYYLIRFKLLLGFIYDTFACDPVLTSLALKNQPESLVRVTRNLNLDPENIYYGHYYVSDARLGSVFIYDASWVLVGEITNLDKPLGVAIDYQGYLLVGNDKQKTIDVYDPANGDLIHRFGGELVQMPTSITIGPDDEIYVTDSKAHRVWVFSPIYMHIRTIGMRGSGDGQLKHPKDSAIISRAGVEEIYISDQSNRRIQVFDTQGNYLRAIDPPMPTFPSFCGFFGSTCPEARGTFTRLQALDFDAAGRLHSLDTFEASVTILNPVSGEVLGSYAAWGNGSGLVNIPLDLLLTNSDEALVIDNKSAEIEVFAIPGLP